MRRVILLLALLCASLQVDAQGFVNLTEQEVKIDTVLPLYSQEFALGPCYTDSVYTVSIDYPEFVDMTKAEIARYQAIDGRPLPSLPVVEQYIAVSRRQGTLHAQLVPLVQRDGKYQKLVSFKLSLKATATAASRSSLHARGLVTYASHSVLATGQWVKISVPSTGIYQLTVSMLRRAGFSRPDRVKVYGYGGGLQPEVLTSGYLSQTDDLHEVPTCQMGNRRLFHATGPVTWSTPDALLRTRNPYSDVGCYFLTENDDEPLMVDSAAFVASFYPTNNDYHWLYETDDYAWYHSGRNLFESTPIPTESYKAIDMPAHAESGRLSVAVSYDGLGMVTVVLNDSVVGTVNVTSTLSSTAKAGEKVMTFNIGDGLLKQQNTVKLRQTAGSATMRLDYVSLTMPTPAPLPHLSSTQFDEPQVMYRITNQDHHADGPADMIIIIPTSQKLLAQAQRLQQLHEELDSLRVRIVPADELMNEFSSGTPDANAYRRYLKMLYDRADSEADMPRFLLLFGDGTWDNRMLTSNWRQTSPDDFLLCYESENSFSETDSYVSDDFFCMLDEGEGASLEKRDRADVGVGRLTARNEAEATILVDKIETYINNSYAGKWQNTLCFMGDDGNNNIHMREAEAAVNTVLAIQPSADVKKIYWDAYQRTSSATGFRYPDVERLVKQQMQQGALIMDYCGHGRADQVSHERVLNINDFAEQTSLRLPLWVTASCDIMPFDSHEENIGETAMFNQHGGAIAFFGTTRTVYTGDNQNMNCAFLKYAVSTGADGLPLMLGDAVRLAKNEVRSIGTSTDPFPELHRSDNYVINKLHYCLLGDPALRLALPTRTIVIDSINGQDRNNGTVLLKAGTQVTVAGHIEGDDTFEGVMTLTVKDIETTVVCRLNNTASDGASSAFSFTDRPVTIFEGQDSISHGHFRQTFVLPQDISYSEESGKIIAYAVTTDRQLMASGTCEDFYMGSNDELVNNGIGPSIYCYLNTNDFQNGGNVNITPYFFAQVTDQDGINAAGSSIGHDMELIIDGDPAMTYNLNQYFQYDFGDYRTGCVGYSLPQLSEGPHTLLFRAWDMLNNSSTAQLSFNVVRALQPQCFSVECTHNPATTQTSFIINHDRTGSQMDIKLEVYDSSGRLLWVKSESGISTDQTYQIDWNLTTDSGSRLRTGVYLYRVLVSSDGSKQASKAQKLIIL